MRTTAVDGGNMKDHRKGIAAAAGFVAINLAAALTVGPANATPASGFTAAQQWKGLYAPMNVKGETDAWEVEVKTKGQSDVYVTRNAIAVGGQSGWHRHPGPSLITVTVGEITAYESDNPLCTPTRYGVGQGFIDSGDHAHLLRNESGAPAETVAVQFLEIGATRRIDAPKPNNCEF
jgi:quercetin dioxygenase-like cupin family protein